MSITTAYSGVVSTVPASGGKVQDVLTSRSSGLASETVSANSLDGPAIVLGWRTAPQPSAKPQLFQCNFKSAQCQTIFPSDSNTEGSGFISPDNQRVVIMMSGLNQQYSLWISDLSGTQLDKLSNPPAGSWDSSPSWSPDGRQILFVRLHRSGGLYTALMKIDSQTGAEKQVLGEQEGVAFASYSPDGKEIAFWSKNGLETMELATLRRTVVRSPASLPGRQFYGLGRLSWSQASDTFAMSFKNTQANNYELVTISRDGTRVNTLYSSPSFRILSVSFVYQKM